MAATVKITQPQLYPAATKVKIFALTAQHGPEFLRANSGSPATWKPAPVELSEQTVASNGTLEVFSMSIGTTYLCWAEVESKDVYYRLGVPSTGTVDSTTTTDPRKVKVKATTTTVAASNAARVGLTIENQELATSTKKFWVGLAGGSAVTEDDIGPFTGGQIWDGRVSGKVWTGAVFAIANEEITVSVTEI